MKVAIFRIDPRKQSDIVMKRQLRYHPKMKQKGYLNWPPGWAGSYDAKTVFPTGEQGILRAVEICERDAIGPRGLVLTTEFRGNRHSGVLRFDDEAVVDPLFDTMKGMIGSEIREIGDIEIDL